MPSSTPARATRSKSTVKEAQFASKTSSQSTRGASKVSASPSYPRFDAKKAKCENFFFDESLVMWDYVHFLVERQLMNCLILSMEWLIF